LKRADPHQRGLVLRFFREFVRPYFGLQLEIGACLVFSVALQLVDPLLLKLIIDRAIGDGDATLLTLLVGVLGVVLIFRVAFRLVSVWLYSYSGLRILFDLRQRVFEHVERTLVNAVQDLLTIIGIFALLLWLDPFLTLGLALAYPPLVFVLMRINRHLRQEGMRAREAIGGLFSFLEERLAGIRLVQEFLREKAEARAHVRVSRPWIAANLNLSMMGAGQISLADLMATGAFILVFLLGGHRTLSGALSLGGLIAFYTLATRLYRPISGLIDINIDLQVARAALGRVFELLDETPQIREAEDATTAPGPTGEIRLEGVELVWPDGTRVLDGIDLTIEPGQVVALVGPSGSGKSTLAAVIARYLDPGQGTVSVAGLDVRRWKLRELRRAIGLVPQETQLFHDTLAANLRLARPAAGDDELTSALQTAGLSEFLSRLPDGLDTIVGEQGLRLSGGERQRLALARALLKRPVVQILDEATSALDPRTERQVLSRMHEQLRGRTLILIAHRLTSITEVDRIFFLHRGRIAEAGSHDELYRADGLYRSLYDEQLRRHPEPGPQPTRP